MRERIGRDPAHRFFFRNQFFVDHVDCDADSGVAGAFAVARLQDVKPFVFDREFEVLHVLEMLLEDLCAPSSALCARPAFPSPGRQSDAACARLRRRLRLGR